MSETLPRWDLPEINFIETDPETIKASIINSYETVAGRTLAVADPIRIFLLSVASEIIQQRVLINQAAKNNLLSYATGGYLDALGVYLSVTRLQASSAVCNIRFTLSQALSEVYTIPAGTEVTNGIVTFATNEDLLIASGTLVGNVSATCTVPGEVGNGYLAGQVSTIVRPMTFVADATNTNETEGGSDEESDEDYAERIRLAPNSFSVAGPKKAYIFHTFSASSAVVDVSVDAPAATPGVVNVYPLLADGGIPDETLRQQIQDYLSADDLRPITDDVHVLAATPVNYQINVRYFISNDDMVRGSSIQAAVAAAVEAYKQWQHSKIGRDILPSKLVAMVINAGACRIDTGMLPGGYTALNATQVAQCVPSYSSGVFTLSANVTNNSTVTIDTVTLTFVQTAASENEVSIGATVAATIENLVSAINTYVNKVVATKNSGNTSLTVTAKNAGASGNSIAFTTTEANATITGISSGKLSGGREAITVTFGGYEEG